MEVMLGKAAAAHAEDDWAGGGKRQVSSLDGHVSVVMDQRPEEHEKVCGNCLCVSNHGRKAREHRVRRRVCQRVLLVPLSVGHACLVSLKPMGRDGCRHREYSACDVHSLFLFTISACLPRFLAQRLVASIYNSMQGGKCPLTWTAEIMKYA
eukprot:1156888-Pelagomonas_calceolata.AAC.9